MFDDSSDEEVAAAHASALAMGTVPQPLELVCRFERLPFSIRKNKREGRNVNTQCACKNFKTLLTQMHASLTQNLTCLMNDPCSNNQSAFLPLQTRSLTRIIHKLAQHLGRDLFRGEVLLSE
jgi:hypothetical protein